MMDNDTQSRPQRPREPFIRRIDWSAFWTSTLAALAVYVYSLPPSVTLEDSGELIVAADFLGVPHPPGYPIWTLTSWLFARLFSFVTYMGQPNPAWSVALASAVFGALAVGLTAMLVCRSGAFMIDELNVFYAHRHRTRSNLICWTAGVVSSLLFAFSQCMWSQSVIAEVYALNAFFLVLLFLLTFSWFHRPTNALLLVTALVFGLGLTNYQVLLLAMAPLAFVILLLNVSLFRDFVVAGIPYVVVIAALRGIAFFPASPHTWLPEITHPLDTIAFVYLAANAIWLIFVAYTLPNGRTVAPAILLAQLGLAFYLMMPLVSDLRNPPMNWGYPRTWEGFNHALSRGQYERIQPVDIFSITFIDQIGAYFTDLRRQFTLPLAVLGFLPFTLWELRPGKRSVRGFTLGVILAVLAGGFAVIEHLQGGDGSLAPIYKTLIALLLLLGVVGVAGVVVNQIGEFARRISVRSAWSSPRAVLDSLIVSSFLAFGVAAYGWFSARVVGEMIDAAATRSLVVELEPRLTRQLSAFLDGTPMVEGKQDIDDSAFKLADDEMGAIQHAMNESLRERIATENEQRRLTPERRARLEAATASEIELAGRAKPLLKDAITYALNFIYSPERAEDALVLHTRYKRADPFSPEEAARVAVERAKSLTQWRLLGMAFVILGPPALLLGVYWLMEKRHVMTLPLGHLPQKWILATLIGFAVMSLMLIALANPKMDLQDYFIQRVKFISSHAIFAFWIGYGLLLSFHTIEELLARFRLSPLAILAPLVALAGPFIPIRENIVNEKLISVAGASEQTLHDFGWQFGNYQLRGAEAILEELDADEEPLPNPRFPPEMGPDAIFFGGTDPGRFVPTYMIYSARVREDVYLITQNALADGTFLQITRDLYGDRIWVPASPDSQEAFQIYLREIESGVRPRNAQIRVEDGRVQITGALGVMEINGILAEQIFRHNNYRHEFYVEESYQIAWMFPFLTPHGLIMKINNQPLPYVPPDIVRDDTDFWDWYTRRLMANPRFLRDVVARKSFSKLRSAIGGVYAFRQDWLKAQTAFAQARMLYPLSPEATIRYVQEVLMPMGRFNDSIDLLTAYAKLDPDYLPALQIRRNVARIRDTTDQISRLSALFQAPENDTDRIQVGFQLARALSSIGNSQMASTVVMQAIRAQSLTEPQLFEAVVLLIANDGMEAAAEIMKTALSSPAIGPEQAHRLAGLLRQTGDKAGTAQALERLEALDPKLSDSPDLIRDVAATYGWAERGADRKRLMERYLKLRGGDWTAWIELAEMDLALNQTPAVLRALEMAIRSGGAAAEERILQNPAFHPHLPMLQRRIQGARPSPLL